MKGASCFALLAFVFVLCACQSDRGRDPRNLEAVRNELQIVLSDEIVSFQLYELNVARLAEELLGGNATLPFITEEGGHYFR